MSVLCEQYSYNDQPNKGEKVVKASLELQLEAAIQAFEKKHGYRPHYIEMRVDEIDNVSYAPLDIHGVTKGLPPHNYRLHPVVKRKPIRKVERISYEG